MIRRPPRSTLSSSSAASDVYKGQTQQWVVWNRPPQGGSGGPTSIARTAPSPEALPTSSPFLVRDTRTRSSPGGLCWGILHRSLLAASPSGEAPDLRCQDAAAGSLTVRRSVALSPVDGRRVLGNRRVSHNSSWTSERQASRAMTRRHLGCIGSPSTTDTTRVHQ